MRYAGKVVMKTSVFGHEIKYEPRELAYLKKLKHKHIIPFHGFLEDEKCWMLVLDYRSNGSLLDMIQARGKLTEPEIKYFGF